MSLLRLIYLWRVGCDGEVEGNITAMNKLKRRIIKNVSLFLQTEK